MILRNDYLLLGTALLSFILLFSSPLLLIILIVITATTLTYLDCDFSLKALELYGLKPEESYLKGSVVWITGASSGIGESVAYEMSRCGARVVLSARNEKELKRVEIQCEKLNCASSLVLPLDITNLEQQSKVLDEIIDKYGKIDVLFNNAGIYQLGYFGQSGFDVVKYVMEVNFTGPAHLAKIVANKMKERNTKGLISVVSSIASAGVSYSAVYCASKAAINALYDSLRGEYYESGIEFQVIRPGLVRTSIAENSLMSSKNEVAGQIGKTAVFSEAKLIEATRCAQLISVALANRVPEVWICLRVQALFAYGMQYLPNIFQEANNQTIFAKMSKDGISNEARLKLRGLF